VQAFINPQKKIITKTIWQLSLVSLFTDMAGEMLYPIMPLYLKSIGFSLFAIGVLEGIAEAVAGLTKSYFGSMSDAKGKRLPFIQIGYTLSALSRPMMALFTAPLWVFFSRTMERLGKGIRTGARDALLSDEATKETKGTVFGFHRSMDTIGAVIGPAIGLLFLYFYKDDYKTLFYIAFVPGLLAIACTLVIKEKPRPALIQYKGQQPGFFAFIHYWKKSSPEYKKLVTGLLAFALVNSSDVFLLLKMKENIGSSHVIIMGATFNADTITIAAYIFYNLIYALSSYAIGVMADRTGFRKMIASGLILFALVYTGFAFNPSVSVIFLLFAVYGVYAAATEGVVKAWITNLSHEQNTATAIGFYTSAESVCSLFASIIAGAIWTGFGSTYTFLICGIVAFVVAIYFTLIFRNK